MISGFNSRLTWYFILMLLIVQSLLLLCCKGNVQTPPEAAPEKPVSFQGEAVIYVVGPMSGPNADKGQSQAAGARLAALELNRKGGVLNRKIIVKTLNDAGESENALAAAQKIASSAKAGENILGIVVHERSDPKLTSVRQVYLNTGSGLNPLVVIPASAEPLPVKINDNRLFRISAPSSSQASEVAVLFREQDRFKVAVVHDSTSYGYTLSREFSNTLEKLGMKKPVFFELPPDAVSYAAEAARVKDISPDALFFAGTDIEASLFFPELFSFEFQGAVFASDRALSYNLIDEIGCQAEGMNFASMLPDPLAVMNPGQLANYEAIEGREAEFYTVAGYTGAEFIVRAFAAANALDADQAATAARQKNLSALIGKIAFNTNGTLQKPKIHFFQVQCRQFKSSFTREPGAGPKIMETAGEKTKTLLKTRFSPDNKPIIFAGLNWGSVRLGNSIARFIIESGYDYPTYSAPGSSVPLFHSLRKGDVHVYMEVWLPNTQELCDKALAEKQVTDLGLNFRNAVQGWFVPRYVVEGDSDRGIKPVAPGLKSVNDLEKYCRIFASKDQPGTGRLIDGSPGWFSYKIGCMKLRAYRLDDKFVQVASGSESALFAELSKAYQAGEPVLVYMYGPSWPMAKFDLIQLKEPGFTQQCWSTDKKCAFPPNQVKKFVHIDLPRRAPEVAEFLGNFKMDRDEISRTLVTMKENNLKPESAAQAWLKKNEDVWSQWVSGNAARNVKKALKQLEE
ncbi:MAG: ABC transporter substrate-binding protein [Desulfobacterales bacterium]|nr:ABC transporter substrate-binding protein [Desulfobacterales bacterium]